MLHPPVQARRVQLGRLLEREGEIAPERSVRGQAERDPDEAYQPEADEHVRGPSEQEGVVEIAWERTHQRQTRRVGTVTVTVTGLRQDENGVVHGQHGVEQFAPGNGLRSQDVPVAVVHVGVFRVGVGRRDGEGGEVSGHQAGEG